MLAITRRPSATASGRCGEPAVEQHELGHRPGRRGAVAHGHPDVGVLERQRVVHPVPGHRHHVPAPLQRAAPSRASDAASPARTRCRSPSAARQRVRVLAAASARRRRRPRRHARDADRGRDRPDRARVVAGDHLERDALVGEVARASRAASARIRSASTTSATGTRPAGRAASPVVGPRCAPRTARAAAPGGPGRPARRRARARRPALVRRRRQHHLRRPEHPGALVARGTADHLRADENGTVAAGAAPRCRELVGQRRGGGVGVGSAAASAPSAAPASSASAPSSGTQPVERDVAVR